MLGLSTPWQLKVQYSTSCRVLAYSFYFIIPGLLLYLATYVSQSQFSPIEGVLITRFAVIAVIEIYTNAYMYNSCNRKFTRFCEVFFLSNEEYLDTTSNAEMINCCREFLLFLVTVASFVCWIIDVYIIRFDFVPFIGVFRDIVVLLIRLQWSLCMHRVDERISNVKRLVTTVLRPNCSNGSIGSTTNLDKVDTIAAVYRTVADSRRSLDEYFGVHMAFNVCTTLFVIVTSFYLSWKLCVEFKDQLLSYYVLTRSCLSLIDILIIAIIGEHAKTEVSQFDFV